MAGMKELINALGGASAIAKELNLAPSRVGNWASRGIPWKFRPAIAKLAQERAVKLPIRFLHEEAA